MQRWSIRRKLILLCTIFLLLLILIGGFSAISNRILTSALDDTILNQLPAVRNMTLADMMHDGLRATVYRAIHASGQNDSEEKKAVEEELKEFSVNIRNYIAAIDKLQVSPKIKEAIDDARPELELYIKNAEHIVSISLSGQRNLAIENLPIFQKSFESLEGKLGNLGELIEKDAENSNLKNEEYSRIFSKFSVILVVCGLLIGALLSVWIIRDLMSTLYSVISNLYHSNQIVSESSSTSSSSALKLSEAVAEQASSLQETMTSIEEISAMVRQNADSAVKVKSLLENNLRVSEEGTRSVSDVMIAIDEIKETNENILNQMESSNREFAEIVKIISEIGEKTKIINDIVFQTKLLSFNASVEAARAGEHGKGFAVVAEEVGNLAQMSGNAAKDISSMLTNSIDKVNEIVSTTTARVDQLVEVGKDKIATGQNVAKRCRDALEKVSDNAQTVTTMINEIAEASKEQSEGIQEINRAVSQLDQVTQQNSFVAQTNSSESEKLCTEAQTLSSSVKNLILVATGQSQYNAN